MRFVDSVSRAFYEIYSQRDEIAEDYIWKNYLGVTELSGLYSVFRNGGVLRILLLQSFRIIIYIFTAKAILGHIVQFARRSMVIFSQAIHYIMMIQLVVVCTVHTQFKRREILSIHRALATGFFDYSEPYEGNRKVLQAEVERAKVIVRIFIMFIVLLSILLMSLENMLNGYGTFDLDQSLNLTNKWLPYHYAYYPYSTEGPLLYYLTALSQLACIFLVGFFFIGGVYSYFNSSLNLSMQLKILSDSVKNVDERALMLLATKFGIRVGFTDQKLYANNDFAYCYNICLKKNLQHHQEIMRIYQDYKSLFSPVIFMVYLTGTILVALSLLCTGTFTELPGTTLSAGMLCLAEIEFMFIISFQGQGLIGLNEDLRFQMYSIKWYHCDESVKRSLRIFQAITLRPLLLMGLGIVPNNMDSFTKVMNSAYSYYNLLNAFDVVK